MKTNIKELETIIRDYNDKKYQPAMPYPNRRRFKEGHVFDEDQSVKWNREQVAIENAKIDAESKAYEQETSRLVQQLHDDIVAALMDEFDLVKEQAEIAWGFAYREKHSYMNDAFYFAREVAEMVERAVYVVTKKKG